MTDRDLPWSSFSGPDPDISGQTISATSFDGDDPLTVTITSATPILGNAYTTTRVLRGIAQTREGHTFAVALKVFPAWALLDIAQRELLRREFVASRRARHRFILPYTGSAQYGFHSLLISPFMENGNLQQYLAKNGLGTWQTLVLQVAAAVEYLHSAVGLVHGDLKCENVLISDTGHALLADFGLSTLVARGDFGPETATEIRLKQTVQFSAPELLLDLMVQESTQLGRGRLRSKTTHTDVYAFGMLILQAYSGKPPWPDYSHTAIIKKVCAKVVHPRPDNHGPFELSDAWWDICLQCWAFDSLERPTMHDVLLGLCESADPTEFSTSELLPDAAIQDRPRSNNMHMGSQVTHTGVYASSMPIPQTFSGSPWPDYSPMSIIARTRTEVVHLGPDSHATPELAGAWWDVSQQCWVYHPLGQSTDGQLELRRSPGPGTPTNSNGTLFESQACRGHTSAVFAVAFMPCGTRIVSGSWDRSVRIWDIYSHECVVGPLIGHTGAIRCVAASPDGQEVASSGGDRTVRCWGAFSGTLLGEPITGHSECVNCIAYSPDAALLVSGSDDMTVRMWRLSKFQKPSKALLVHDSSVLSVAFSPDGSCFASGSKRGPVRLWRSSDGQQLVRIAVHNGAPVHSLSFSPEGELFISTDQHKSVHICTAHMPLSERKMTGHSELVRAVAISPSGQYVASASDDTTIRIWDTHTGCLVGAPLREHTGFVKCVAFSPCGKYLVSGSWDTTVRVWDFSWLEGFDVRPFPPS